MQKTVIFLLLLLLVFIHHFFGFFGHYGYDDIMGYAFFAQKWANGNFFYLSEDFFSFRWGFIIPTSISYRLFGVSDWSSALFPTVIYLSTIGLLSYSQRAEKKKVLLYSLLLFALDPWTLYYSDKPMPDSTVAFCSFLAFIALKESYHKPPKKQLLWAGLFSLSLFWGYLTKQTILLLAPCFAFLFLRDLWNKAHQRFWLVAITLCSLLGLSYLGFIGFLTGNPLARFELAELGHQANLNKSYQSCNYLEGSWSFLLERLFFGLPKSFLSSGSLLILLLTLPQLFKVKNYWSRVFLLAFLSCNFMTTSLNGYQPICVDVRHFLLLTPIAAILASKTLEQITQHQKLLIIAYLLAFSAGIYLEIGRMSIAYLLFALSIVSYSKLKHYSIYLLFMSLFLPGLSSMRSASKNEYATQKKFLQDILQKDSTVHLISSEVSTHFALYYAQFDSSRLKAYRYAELENVQSNRFYLLRCSHNWSLSSNKDQPKRACLLGYIERNKVLPIKESQGVELYQLSTKVLQECIVK